MERIFQIVAVILAGIAAYFYWRGNSDGVFISGVLGAVSFFLSFRFQAKDRMKKLDEDEKYEAPELEEKMRFEDELETRDFRKDNVER
ncbi:MAG: hypothetical protein ABIP06_08025 [Pyrinomonadaceae bacterium]